MVECLSRDKWEEKTQARVQANERRGVTREKKNASERKLVGKTSAGRGDVGDKRCAGVLVSLGGMTRRGGAS
jgi:hypothetical protein